jgi:hypothetical protein
MNTLRILLTGNRCWSVTLPLLLQIDTVRAYVFGSHMFAEVDIVLPGSMPLREAHDIGEGERTCVLCVLVTC